MDREDVNGVNDVNYLRSEFLFDHFFLDDFPRLFIQFVDCTANRTEQTLRYTTDCHNRIQQLAVIQFNGISTDRKGIQNLTQHLHTDTTYGGM